MAPLPPESTARAWLDYNDGINEHSIQMRLGPTATLVNINTSFHTLLTALAPILHQLTIVGLRVASDNSNVTNPATWTGSATYGTGTLLPEDAPREIRFIGRSADGRQGSASVFGYSGTTPAIYRLNNSITQIFNAIAVLDAGYSSDLWLSISTQRLIWKPYASFNFNSYWEKEARP
jgi:hypothetical protein